ncbi:DUF397 domain-containing protein [Saccharopolyspora hordei]|uniref:DUF397 domain-containing protein n=1 Tax=Saccharopolyspora hordei TaxID=1838 RepID=A0A853AQ16_9PSEU|nr:DUF397 domain-containing protein [Saccharopolyspora hordei]NYI82561.1 hypothetical protein [Saccharopolyspora hordei]
MTYVLGGWRKSSYSGAQADCVEVGWSSHGGSPSDSVEVVGVRDSKDRDGAVLVFPRRQWAAFVSGLRERG